MTQERGGRLIICCDNCSAQMDLGLAQVARHRNRGPSGWVASGYNRHYCPHCSQAIGLANVTSGRFRHAPLVAEL